MLNHKCPKSSQPHPPARHPSRRVGVSRQRGEDDACRHQRAAGTPVPAHRRNRRPAISRPRNLPRTVPAFCRRGLRLRRWPRQRRAGVTCVDLRTAHEAVAMGGRAGVSNNGGGVGGWARVLRVLCGVAVLAASTCCWAAPATKPAAPPPLSTVDLAQCRDDSALRRMLVPPAHMEPCVLLPRHKSDDFFEINILAMESVEFAVPDLVQWFKRHLKWHCAPRGEAAKPPAGLRMRLEDTTGGSDADDAPARALELMFDHRFREWTDIQKLRNRFHLAGSNSPKEPITLRFVEAPRALPSFIQLVARFPWFGAPVALEVNTSQAFNWIRFDGALAWVHQIADTLVRDYRNAEAKSARDSAPAANAAARSAAVRRGGGGGDGGGGDDDGGDGAGVSSDECPFTLRFLDLGAGSGFLGVLVAAALRSLFPAACFHVVTTDIAAAATDLQHANVRRNGLEGLVTPVTGDMFQPLHAAGMGAYFDAAFFYPPQIVQDHEARPCSVCGPNTSLFVNGPGTGARVADTTTTTTTTIATATATTGGDSNSSNRNGDGDGDEEALKPKHSEGAGFFFNRFREGVAAVMRTVNPGAATADPSPRRAWLGVDEENLPFAVGLKGWAPHACYTFMGHPSELLEHHLIAQFGRGTDDDDDDDE